MFECTFLVNKCTQIGLGNSKHVMRIPDCKPIKFNYICYALQSPFKKKKGHRGSAIANLELYFTLLL